MTTDIEMFNHHQQDTRSRADSLIKAMLILAGGSLTVSIGLFLQKNHLPLSDCSLIVIQASWWLFFASIILGVLTLYIIVMRDYFFGERWRKRLNGNTKVDVSNSPGIVEALILWFGSLGVLTFILGMVCLAYVATITIANTSQNIQV